MTADPLAARDERLAERLARLEQQIRSFRELHVAEVADLAKKLGTLAQLHADELQLVLDELAEVAREVAARRATAGRPESGAAAATAAPHPGAPAASVAAPLGDPAAGSPKRAAWLAEEELRARPAPVSRRELLFGRESDAGPERGPSGPVGDADAPRRSPPGSR